MYSSKLDIFYLKYFNVYFAVHYMHSLGLRKEQIMVGIPFYGYLYYLANPQFHGVYALSNGTQGTLPAAGLFGGDICLFIPSDGISILQCQSPLGRCVPNWPPPRQLVSLITSPRCHTCTMATNGSHTTMSKV